MRRVIAYSSLAAVLVTLAGCATTPEDDPVLQGKLNDLDARTARIERVISNQSLLDMAQSINSLQTQVRMLQGRIDELENMNDALRKQQRALYSDLDRRIGQLAAGGGVSAAVGPSGPSGPPPGSEQAAYMQALDSLKNGKYPDAIGGLKQFLTAYPKSDLADNAQYWLGEAYYASGDFSSSADAFQTLLHQWPSSSKAADALLRLGYAQYELKQYADARATLGEVAQKYPGTNAAQQAQDRLRQLTGGSEAAPSDSH